MHDLSIQYMWRRVYPYLVIGQISVLVIGSLVFLALNQLMQNLVIKFSPKEELGYVNRAN